MNSKELKELLKNPTEYAEELKTSELVKLLKHFSDAYYNTDTELVSDDVYDELVDVLKEKDPKNKFLEQTGAKTTDEKHKVTLPFYIGSLDKKKPGSKELAKWFDDYDTDYVVSDKLDGNSAVLQKKDGKLYMYSRGDGIVGQNISHLIELIFDKSFITSLPKSDFVVRGELIATIKDFKSLKDKVKTSTDKTLKNARNMVAGLVNSKTIDDRRKQIAKVTNFVAYRVYQPIMKPSDQLAWLEKHKFDVVHYEIFEELDDNDLKQKLLDRKVESEYDIDGLVVASDDIYKLVPEKYPKDSFAYKLPSAAMQTKVIEVEWNESQYGYLKPRILVETIKLPDVDIKYATAHNAKYIVDHDIGPGAIVEIIRSGDVIPKIVNVVKPAKKVQMPDVEYKWNETKVDLIATGKKSQTVLIKELTSFFKIIGAEFLGLGVITKLVNNGFNSEKKIIAGNPDQMAEIEGLGMKSVAKIKQSIYDSITKLTLSKYMYASHVFGRGFGEKKIRAILNVYPNIHELKHSEKKLTEMITDIDGFDTKTAKVFASKLPAFITYANKLHDVIDISKLGHVKKTKKKDGITVVFTGFRDKDLEAAITDNGGKVSTSVSKNTTVVVAKDANDDSGKATKARKLGIKVIDIDEFKEKYNY